MPADHAVRRHLSQALQCIFADRATAFMHQDVYEISWTINNIEQEITFNASITGMTSAGYFGLGLGDRCVHRDTVVHRCPLVTAPVVEST